METKNKKYWFITSNQQSRGTVAQEAILAFLAQAEGAIIEDSEIESLLKEVNDYGERFKLNHKKAVVPKVTFRDYGDVGFIGVGANCLTLHRVNAIYKSLANVEEVWRECPNHKSYEASNLGNVRQASDKQLLKSYLLKDGNIAFCLEEGNYLDLDIIKDAWPDYEKPKTK